jgi:hypothetical protein
MQPTAQAVGGSSAASRLAAGANQRPFACSQNSKHLHLSNSPLRFLALLWYKQFTESICVAGWALFCNSRARPASKVLRGIKNPSIAPATGLDSETTSRFLKGTFKARTSKSKFFSQFSVFRFGVRRT